MAVDFIRNRVSPEEALLLGRQAEVRDVGTDDDLDTRPGSTDVTADEADPDRAHPLTANAGIQVDGRARTETYRYVGAGGTGAIFVSHSARDALVAEELILQMRAAGLVVDSLHDFDPGKGIPAGQSWERELYARLRRADAVIFLASSASVSSSWNLAEIGLARALGRPVFPVRIEPDARLALLDDIQWLDATDVGGGGTHRVVARLLVGLRQFGIDPSDTYAWDPARSPYPGLAPFTVQDSAVFFGRDQEVDRLMEFLQRTPARGKGRLVALVGPSGSGKSSLLHAGLLPRLLRRDAWVVLPPFLPGADPTRRLAGSLAAALSISTTARAMFTSWSPRWRRRPTVCASCSANSPNPAPRAPPAPRSSWSSTRPRSCSPRTGPGEQERFLRALRTALNGNTPTWAVATIRSEFLSTSPDRAGLTEAIDDTIVIEPLSRPQLSEVIIRPAQRAGLTFVPGLVERMVEDTQRGDALPLLASTLRELASHARPDGTISHADYDAIGGVIGALRHRADEVTHELTTRRVGRLVVPTLLRLVAVARDGEPTRRRLSRTTLDDDELAVVNALVDARLLITDQTAVEVTHEALLRQWPPLYGAIEESWTQLRLRTELEGLVTDWEQGSRDEAYLLRGSRLAALEMWAHDHGDELDADEKAFLEASRSTARRTIRRLRRLLVAICILLLILLVSTVIGVQLYQELERLQRT